MRSRERRTTRTLVAALAGIALVAAGCGSDESTDEAPSTTEAAESTDTDVETTEPADTAATGSTADTEPAGTEPVSTEPTGTTAGTAPGTDAAGDGEIPERVVSLSPTHTEIMFAIGADDLLVSVDDQSNYPEAALDLPNDLSGFEPNVEAIAAFDPDLVLLSDDGLVGQLDDLGIDSFVGPAATTFDDTYTQIEQLGAMTGHVGDAAELVSSMQTRIDELSETAPALDAPLTYYHELTDGLFTATSSTFIGEVYGIFGLTNIADELEADAGQFPQLNAEFLVDASPDLVFLADTKCCDVTPESFGEREGFGSIAAVQNGNVIGVDDDIASRWGPRIVDYVELVSGAVEQAAVGV